VSKYPTIARDLALVAVLFVIIPFAVLYLLGLPNGLISALIYFQLIIIWIQTELSMSQLALYRSQANPILVLRLSSGTTTLYNEGSKVTKNIMINVKNLSDNPAFNILLSRVLSENHNPVPPNIWRNLIRCSIIEHLAPKEEKELCALTSEDLQQLLKVARVLEISYIDRYGDWHYMDFMISIDKEADMVLMPIPYEEEPGRIGLLLPALTRIALLLRLYKVLRKFRKKGALQ